MHKVDKSRPVLVTGATGYVAGWLVARLLEDGFTVHAAVRDPGNAEKLGYLNALAEAAPGTIRYFASDLLVPGSYAEAMRDCATVFHIASPFTIRVRDARKELIEPARSGTRNVLHQANETESVERVVITSSCAAIYGDNADLADAGKTSFSEADWNTTASVSHQPYAYSKVLAEREAWDIAGKQQRWKLVSVNPSLVLGPGVNPFAGSESFTVMRRFGDGTMARGVPDLAFGVVDVRDVAEAHLAAAFMPGANGRYIVSGCDTDLMEIGRILHEAFGDSYPFPKRTLPKWLVWLVGPMLDRSLTRRMVARNVGYSLHFDNSRSIRELGLRYRPLKASVTEMFDQLIENGIVHAKR